MTDEQVLTESPYQQALPTAAPSEIVLGPAQILTAIDGNKVETFTVEIEKIMPTHKDGKGLVIRVTDPVLLEKTGGIVQGMSGSPIIQNGKIIGAVTHVFINDPTRGYGILIHDMLQQTSILEETDTTQQAAAWPREQDVPYILLFSDNFYPETETHKQQQSIISTLFSAFFLKKFCNFQSHFQSYFYKTIQNAFPLFVISFLSERNHVGSSTFLHKKIQNNLFFSVIKIFCPFHYHSAGCRSLSFPADCAIMGKQSIFLRGIFMDRQFAIFMVIALYMVIMIGIGFYYARRNTSVSDYVLGGRSLNPWVTALSAQASDMSGWLLTGLPGLAYLSLSGFKEASWTAIGLAIGTF